MHMWHWTTDHLPHLEMIIMCIDNTEIRHYTQLPSARICHPDLAEMPADISSSLLTDFCC